ncbi:hypothetical protein PO909_027537 [Leuciscus waleckii]
MATYTLRVEGDSLHSSPACRMESTALINLPVIVKVRVTILAVVYIYHNDKKQKSYVVISFFSVLAIVFVGIYEAA